MTVSQKKTLIRIVIASFLLIFISFLKLEGFVALVCYLVPYFIVGYDIVIKAIKGIISLQPFDENLLMVIATVGAILLAIYSSNDYIEAIAVMLFYQIGELFQSCAVGKSRRNISELMDIRADYANIEIDGKLEQVDPNDLDVGTIIVVKPGEKIPIDGVITEGKTTLNTSALTGESLPRTVNVGDSVISGCINDNAMIKIKTTKMFEESTVSKILELVENASSNKSKSEKFITRFSRIYTPVVVISAIVLAIFPPLCNIFIFSNPSNFFEWVYRALTFLVISCPCALVISIPLSYFAGIGGASREGILIKGSNYLEMLSSLKTVVMDKTGTLTQGVFEVEKITPIDFSEQELLFYASKTESFSTHPVAKALRNKYQDLESNTTVEQVEEFAGLGVSALVNGKKVFVGNKKLIKSIGLIPQDVDSIGTIIHIAIENKYAGFIVISDKLKTNSFEAIAELKNLGVKDVVMLTGDIKKVAEKVANTLGISSFYSELLPVDKVLHVENLLKNKNNSILAFVGDGINDAPVLKRADLGIAMGGLGSDAAIEASDIVLMDDNPLSLCKAIKISKKCMNIVKQNIFLALFFKFICLILGLFGFVNMWFAIFADVGVMIIAVLNSIRILFMKTYPGP